MVLLFSGFYCLTANTSAPASYGCCSRRVEENVQLIWEKEKYPALRRLWDRNLHTGAYEREFEILRVRCPFGGQHPRDPSNGLVGPFENCRVFLMILLFTGSFEQTQRHSLCRRV